MQNTPQEPIRQQPMQSPSPRPPQQQAVQPQSLPISKQGSPPQRPFTPQHPYTTPPQPLVPPQQSPVVQQQSYTPPPPSFSPQSSPKPQQTPKRKHIRIIKQVTGLGGILAAVAAILAILQFFGVTNIWSLAHMGPLPTPTPLTPTSLYSQATSGQPVLNDSLSTNDTDNWEVQNTIYGACIFTAGAYHAIARPLLNGAYGCFYPTYYDNLAFQAEMTILQGGGGGGLLFRSGGGPDTNGFGYQFGLYQDHVALWYAGKQLISSTAFKAQVNRTYLLTVIARGNTINAYVDKQWVGSAEDNTASTGKIGLAAYGQNNLTEVAFSNAEVWTL